MLISTVCKTHGLSRIRGPILLLRFLHLRPCYARLLRRYVITPCLYVCADSRGRSIRASGGTRVDRCDRFLIFTSEPGREEISLPTLRSRSAGRSLESVVSSDFHCVASGRAPVSLTMACVLNWSPCRGGTRRYTVYKYH